MPLFCEFVIMSRSQVVSLFFARSLDIVLCLFLCVLDAADLVRPRVRVLRFRRRRGCAWLRRGAAVVSRWGGCARAAAAAGAEGAALPLATCSRPRGTRPPLHVPPHTPITRTTTHTLTITPTTRLQPLLLRPWPSAACPHFSPLVRLTVRRPGWVSSAFLLYTHLNNSFSLKTASSAFLERFFS